MNRRATEQSEERQARWEREHVQSLRQLLEKREGVRPALVSRHLNELLLQLGEPERR